MISPHHLTVVMWTVVAGWAATTVLMLLDFEIRSRRYARASGLVTRLTADRAAGRTLPELTLSQFQALVHQGLPRRVETALAAQVRAHEGDALLLALANGSQRAPIDDRLQALQVLASSRHPEAHAALSAALRSSQPEVAAMALRLLRGLDDERAVEVLAAALAAGAASPSRIAAAIDRMTADRGPYLGPLLRHQSQTVRFWSLLLVGRAGASPWIGDVRRLTTDPSAQVRRAAIEALGRIANPADHGRVLACLADPVPMVRVHAARAAASFAGAMMSRGLARLLSDREWVVRAAARDSLCRMGAAATEAVTRTLWEADPFAANNAAEVLFLTGATRSFIARVLRLPNDRALIRLIDRLIAASGPQISRAVYDQLESHEQVELKRILAGAAAVASGRAS
jgi:HEAT repeat protein